MNLWSHPIQGREPLVASPNTKGRDRLRLPEAEAGPTGSERDDSDSDGRRCPGARASIGRAAGHARLRALSKEDLPTIHMDMLAAADKIYIYILSAGTLRAGARSDFLPVTRTSVAGPKARRNRGRTGRDGRVPTKGRDRMYLPEAGTAD